MTRRHGAMVYGRTAAVVPAGGTGTRMQRRQPKQYLDLGGVPLLVRTLWALVGSGLIDSVVVAAPAERVAATRRLLRRHGVPRVLDVVAGGSDRQESVWCALHALPEDTAWIVVHDAVRPFINRDLVHRVLTAARSLGAAVCGLPVRETVKRVRGDIVEATLQRDGLWLIQTPQAFSRALLWEAHEKASRDGFRGTDDSALVERLGGSVAVVPGLARNLKVTTPDDLSVARRRVAHGRAVAR